MTVKVDDSDVINFLLTTEIIPLCLRIMETGSELSKTVLTGLPFFVTRTLMRIVGGYLYSPKDSLGRNGVELHMRYL